MAAMCVSVGLLVIYANLWVLENTYRKKNPGIFRTRTFSPKKETAIESSNRMPCASGIT